MCGVAEKARALCEEVHASQVDKAGMPYPQHPIRVAGLVSHHPNFLTMTPNDQEAVLCAGYLHDVIEDSPEQPCGAVTAADLLDRGFPEQTVDIVVLLTRSATDGKTDTYYERIKVNDRARVVKLADIADNRNRFRQDLLRRRGITPNEDKYLHALEVLELTSEEDAWMQKAVESPLEMTGASDDS
jgi:(p)ppGpp synthase/HD superfamily hydrolase